jgi:Putative auto-transporter adhesin, head GIN domain
MKSLRSFAIAILILGISSCTHGQFWKTVYGNNKVVTKERKTESFTGIKVSSGIDVYLKQGNNESVSVEADENLHEYILTEVRGGVLNVYSEYNIRDAERKRVYVTMKEVNSVRTTSAGDVFGETPIHTDRLELSASSAGDIKLEVNAKEINIDISSSGDMTLSGETDMLKADLSSAGDLNAYELKTRETDVSVSSAGDADVYATEKITARASSAGDVNYKGDPKYVDAHASSAGGVHKR